MSNILKREYAKSYLLDDIEEAHINRSNGMDGSQIFQLKVLVKKAWTVLNDVNSYICNQSSHYILSTKPIFDKQKLCLVFIDSFIEKDLNCGTILEIRERQPFDIENELAANTDFPEWNELAGKINQVIHEINSTIEAELQIKRLKAPQRSQYSPHTAWNTQTKVFLFWVMALFALVGFVSTSYIIGVELHTAAWGEDGNAETSRGGSLVDDRKGFQNGDNDRDTRLKVRVELNDGRFYQTSIPSYEHVVNLVMEVNQGFGFRDQSVRIYQGNVLLIPDHTIKEYCPLPAEEICILNANIVNKDVMPSHRFHDQENSISVLIRTTDGAQHYRTTSPGDNTVEQLMLKTQFSFEPVITSLFLDGVELKRNRLVREYCQNVCILEARSTLQTQDFTSSIDPKKTGHHKHKSKSRQKRKQIKKNKT